MEMSVMGEMENYIKHGNGHGHGRNRFTLKMGIKSFTCLKHGKN